MFQLISDPAIVESNRWIALVHRWLGGPEHRVFVVLVEIDDKRASADKACIECENQDD